MKRNVFGALIVAGGLALWSSVAGFADFTAQSAKDAIDHCVNTPPLVLTDPASFSGETAAEVTELNQETTVGLAEIASEAKASIDEAVAENADEDGGNNATELNAELTAIVTEACKAITNLKAEYAAAIAELKAESTQVEQKQTEKPDVEKPETEREGND